MLVADEHSESYRKVLVIDYNLFLSTQNVVYEAVIDLQAIIVVIQAYYYIT